MSTLKRLIPVISLTALSSCLELFDFISFIFLSPILAKVFFPLQSSSQGLLYTFIIFATGYFCRPIGGLILAHFGDRYGRKGIFIFSLCLMSLPSFILALLPTPENLGWAAPFLLALLRMAQGISLGGEVAGSITYVAEFTSDKWRTLACSFIPASANMGVALAALFVHQLNQQLSPEAMLTYGWRVPFLIGALLGLLALYLRKNFLETPLFLDLQKKQKLESLPLIQVLKKDGRAVLFGASIALIVANSTSTFHLFFPVYLSHYLHYNSQDVFLISSAGVFTLALFTPLFALSSRFIGRKNQALMGCIILFLICGNSSIHGLTQLSLHGTYIFVISTTMAIALINSVVMAILVDLFPTARRFTGTALTYNMGMLLGAGFTPALNTYLISATGYLNTPFVLVTACAALSSLMIFSIPHYFPNHWSHQ